MGLEPERSHFKPKHLGLTPKSCGSEPQLFGLKPQHSCLKQKLFCCEHKSFCSKQKISCFEQERFGLKQEILCFERQKPDFNPKKLNPAIKRCGQKVRRAGLRYGSITFDGTFCEVSCNNVNRHSTAHNSLEQLSGAPVTAAGTNDKQTGSMDRRAWAARDAHGRLLLPGQGKQCQRIHNPGGQPALRHHPDFNQPDFPDPPRRIRHDHRPQPGRGSLRHCGVLQKRPEHGQRADAQSRRFRRALRMDVAGRYTDNAGDMEDRR